MKWLVFSKDRPYQLDAFLRTSHNNAKINPKNITVLYRYSDCFLGELNSLFKEHPDVEFTQQKVFQDDVLTWVSRNESDVISFATDDALFTRYVPHELISSVIMKNPSIISFSLRMGLHLDHCYPTNTHQRIPDGMIQNGMFVWNSNIAEGDWGYPLSLDGHAFNRSYVKEMLSSFTFKSPNSLESNWQILRNQISPLACCLPNSCYFNVPINRVQNDYLNRSGDIPHQELASLYREGIRYNPESCYGIFNRSAHEEINIR